MGSLKEFMGLQRRFVGVIWDYICVLRSLYRGFGGLDTGLGGYVP